MTIYYYDMYGEKEAEYKITKKILNHNHLLQTDKNGKKKKIKVIDLSLLKYILRFVMLSILVFHILCGVCIAASQYDQMITAIDKNDIAIVKRLLKSGIDLNKSPDTRVVPLTHAAKKGRLVIAKLLIEAGASVNGAKSDSMTPLTMASKQGHTEVIKVLLSAGADVEKESAWGETALMCAAGKGHVDAVKVLIAAGAKINHTLGKGGRTSLDLARDNGHEDIVKILNNVGGKASPPPVTRDYQTKVDCICGDTIIEIVTGYKIFSQDLPPQCNEQQIMFTNKNNGQSFVTSQMGLPYDEMLSACAYSYKCVTGQGKHYLLLYYETGGNCAECTWQGLLDLKGNRLVIDRNKKQKAAFERNWKILGISGSPKVEDINYESIPD